MVSIPENLDNDAVDADSRLATIDRWLAACSLVIRCIDDPVQPTRTRKPTFSVSHALAVTSERTDTQSSGRHVQDIRIRLLLESDEFRIWPKEEKDKVSRSFGGLWG